MLSQVRTPSDALPAEGMIIYDNAYNGACYLWIIGMWTSEITSSKLIFHDIHWYSSFDNDLWRKIWQTSHAYIMNIMWISSAKQVFGYRMGLYIKLALKPQLLQTLLNLVTGISWLNPRFINPDLLQTFTGRSFPNRSCAIHAAYKVFLPANL